MRGIFISIFLILTFFCHPAMGMTAGDWFNNAKALWDENGGKIYRPRKGNSIFKQCC